MDDLEKKVLEVISKRNFMNPVSRGDLVFWFGQSDRMIRKAIESLRGTPEGCFICSSLKGGYYMAEDEAELEKAIGSDERRAIKIFQRCRTQRKNAKLTMNPEVKAEIESQREMFPEMEVQSE
jgi:hypothetical protein